MTNPHQEAEVVRNLASAYQQMTEQIGKVIVGQTEVVEQLLMALSSPAHCLLAGAPPLTKTPLGTTATTLRSLSCRRTPSPPDLRAEDSTGSRTRSCCRRPGRAG